MLALCLGMRFEQSFKNLLVALLASLQRFLLRFHQIKYFLLPAVRTLVLGSGTLGRDRTTGKEFVFFQHRVKDCRWGFLVALFGGFQHEKNTRCKEDLHFD